MLTIQTIEELEIKVLKAVELIGDLRLENSRIESENETLRSENDQMKIGMEDKEEEISSLKSNLSKVMSELDGLKSKEKSLEDKISELLNKLEKIMKNEKNLTEKPKVAVSKQPQKKVELTGKPDKKVKSANLSDDNFSTKFTSNEEIIMIDDEDADLLIPSETSKNSLSSFDDDADLSLHEDQLDINSLDDDFLIIEDSSTDKKRS